MPAEQERDGDLVELLRLFEMRRMTRALENHKPAPRDAIAHVGTVLRRASAVVTTLDDHRRNANGSKLVEGAIDSVGSGRLDRGGLRSGQRDPPILGQLRCGRTPMEEAIDDRRNGLLVPAGCGEGVRLLER